MLALCGPAFTAGCGQAVKGKAVNALFLQMEEGALDQRGVVGSDVVNRRIALRAVEGAADADNWNINVEQQVLNLRVVVIGNNAVA